MYDVTCDSCTAGEIEKLKECLVEVANYISGKELPIDQGDDVSEFCNSARQYIVSSHAVTVADAESRHMVELDQIKVKYENTLKEREVEHGYKTQELASSYDILLFEKDEAHSIELRQLQETISSLECELVILRGVEDEVDDSQQSLFTDSNKWEDSQASSRRSSIPVRKSSLRPPSLRSSFRNKNNNRDENAAKKCDNLPASNITDMPSHREFATQTEVCRKGFDKDEPFRWRSSITEPSFSDNPGISPIPSTPRRSLNPSSPKSPSTPSRVSPRTSPQTPRSPASARSQTSPRTPRSPVSNRSQTSPRTPPRPHDDTIRSIQEAQKTNKEKKSSTPKTPLTPYPPVLSIAPIKRLKVYFS
eukprot:sb/3465999/